MKVRFTARALVQIRTALDYVAQRSPQGAAAISDRVSEIAALLEFHPQAGYPTNRAGVRRLLTVPYTYLLDYRLTVDEVIVMRFRHTSRRPSP